MWSGGLSSTGPGALCRGRDLAGQDSTSYISGEVKRWPRCGEEGQPTRPRLLYGSLFPAAAWRTGPRASRSGLVHPSSPAREMTNCSSSQSFCVKPEGDAYNAGQSD